MATNVGNLEFVLSLDDSPLKRGSRSAKSVLKGLDGAFAKMANISLASSGIATFGRKLYEFGSTFVNAAADLEKLTQGLTAVAGSSREADEQLDRLRQVAKLPGLGLEEAVEGSINLQAVGLSSQQAEAALMSFGNALATVGKGKAELDGVILALTQMAAKGKISAEEINQIGERVPQIRAVMLEAFGTAVPQEIEKMGITADAFIDTVTAKLGALPSVAGGASNAFENLADATRGFQAQLGELILPEVTSMVNALAGTFETLSESMNTPSEQIRDIASDFEEAKDKFDDQSKSIKDLTEEYNSLKEQLSKVNPGTEEARRLNTRLQGTITNLISLVPQLAGKLDLETSSFKDLNTTIATNLELRRSMLTAEFVTGLDRFTQQVDAAQKRMSELKTAQTELAGLGNQRLVTDAGATRATGIRMVETEGGDQLSATAQKLIGDSTQVADVLVRVRQEMVKNGGTMDLLAVKFAQVAEAAGEGTVPALRDLAQLQSVKEVSAVGEYNDALGTMAQRLNLSTATLEKFLPLINQIPEVAQQAADGLDGAGDSAKKALKAPSGKMVLGSPEWMTANLERYRKLKEEKEKLEAQELSQAERTATQAERTAQRTAKERQKIELQAIKDGIEQTHQMSEAGRKISDERRAKRLEDQQTQNKASWSAYFQWLIDREVKYERDRVARMNAIDRASWSHQPEGAGRLGFGQMGGDRPLENVTKDARTAKDELADLAGTITQISDAFSALGETIGLQGSALQEGFDFVGNAASAITRMASGDMVGGVIQLTSAVINLIPAFKKLKEAARQAPILDDLRERVKAIPDAFIEGVDESRLNDRIKKLSGLEEQAFDDRLRVVNRSITRFEDTALQMRSTSQMLGDAMLEGIREGFSQDSMDKTLELVGQSMDRLLSGMILEAALDKDELQPKLDELAAVVTESLSDGMIKASEATKIQGLREGLDNLTKRVRTNALRAFDKLGLDTETLFPDPDKDMAKKDDRSKRGGLSLAIKQITTRQADELAFVLRTTQGLSQQIAINTDRSASSLEEWLPFISERLDNIDRLPGAAAAANGGGAEDNIRADRQALGANFLDFQQVGLPAAGL